MERHQSDRDRHSDEAGRCSETILEVRGVSSNTIEDTVMFYFENTCRSGGGDIKRIKSEDGIFYIKFEDDQGKHGYSQFENPKSRIFDV